MEERAGGVVEGPEHRRLAAGIGMAETDADVDDRGGIGSPEAAQRAEAGEDVAAQHPECGGTGGELRQ
jgi:hypothetical protein